MVTLLYAYVLKKVIIGHFYPWLKKHSLDHFYFPNLLPMLTSVAQVQMGTRSVFPMCLKVSSLIMIFTREWHICFGAK